LNLLVREMDDETSREGEEVGGCLLHRKVAREREGEIRWPSFNDILTLGGERGVGNRIDFEEAKKGKFSPERLGGRPRKGRKEISTSSKFALNDDNDTVPFPFSPFFPHRNDQSSQEEAG